MKFWAKCTKVLTEVPAGSWCATIGIIDCWFNFIWLSDPNAFTRLKRHDNSRKKHTVKTNKNPRETWPNLIILRNPSLNRKINEKVVHQLKVVRIGSDQVEQDVTANVSVIHRQVAKGALKPRQRRLGCEEGAHLERFQNPLRHQEFSTSLGTAKLEHKRATERKKNKHGRIHYASAYLYNYLLVFFRKKSYKIEQIKVPEWCYGIVPGNVTVLLGLPYWQRSPGRTERRKRHIC